MTTSAAIFLPDASVVIVPRPELSTEATSSPKRNDIVWSRRWNFSDSTISGSQKSSIWSRFSTRVTRVPSAAKIDAYSTPMTPAPTTTSESGTVSKVRIWSESRTLTPSKSTWSGRAGVVPVAMTTLSAVRVRCDPEPSMSIESVCGSRKLAAPAISSMWLRISCDRMTSVSRPITCCSRASRSEMVMSSLTR